MPRGITQEQVNDAADTILGAGENPTVEKVRTELGTGSPNTITRMLDTWRRGLGERIRQLTALPGVPSPVGQAMVDLWRLATEHAEKELGARFEAEEASLAQARDELARERAEWDARLRSADTEVAQALTARDQAERTRSTLEDQLQESQAVRTDLVRQRDRLQDLCDRQAAELQQLHTQLEEQQISEKEHRTRQEAYLRSIEDRAHREIDCAREEAREWQRRLEVAEQEHRDEISGLRVQLLALSDKMRVSEQELARFAGLVEGLEKAVAKARSTPSSRRPKTRNKSSGRVAGPAAPKKTRRTGKGTSG